MSQPFAQVATAERTPAASFFDVWNSQADLIGLAAFCLLICFLFHKLQGVTKELLVTRQHLATALQATETHSATERRRSQIDRNKDQFLAVLAHELCSPIAALTNSVEAMSRSGCSSAMHQELLPLQQRQLQLLKRLTDDLLHVERIAQNQIEIEREEVDLCDIIQQAVTSSTAMYAKRSPATQIVASQEHVMLKGDPCRLLQVMVNLLNHSMMSTQQCSRISVHVFCEGETAVIQVNDDGMGIAPEQLKDIFDHYLQARAGFRRSSVRIGIGLCVVKQIVELHGGTVSAVSDGVGMGSQFTIRLPTSTQQSSSRHPSARQGEFNQDIDRHRVALVVLPDRSQADAIAETISPGFRIVETTTEPTEALVIAERTRPALVILALKLGDASLQDLCAELRFLSGGEQLTIVSLSNAECPQELALSTACGCNLHVCDELTWNRLAHHLRNQC